MEAILTFYLRVCLLEKSNIWCVRLSETCPKKIPKENLRKRQLVFDEVVAPIVDEMLANDRSGGIILYGYFETGKIKGGTSGILQHSLDIIKQAFAPNDTTSVTFVQTLAKAVWNMFEKKPICTTIVSQHLINPHIQELRQAENLRPKELKKFRSAKDHRSPIKRN